MKKILIVDDSDSLRILLNETLEGHQFKILEAKNGDEAIMISQMEEPNLIILDLMMPGRSGMDVLGVLKKTITTRNIPVIILSAKGQAADKEKALELGAKQFLTKPFSPIELLAWVDHILLQPERKA